MCAVCAYVRVCAYVCVSVHVPVRRACVRAYVRARVIHPHDVHCRARLTCPEEHDLVLAVLGRDPVHHDLRECVVGAHQLEDGPAVQREHRAVHQRVEADEAHHLVGEVFGGLDLGVVGLAGTLRRRLVMIS